MIRRSWVIYRRKSRRIVSVVYHFRKDALHDLKRLNDYYGRRHYAMRLTKTDSETGKIISRYPDISLKELPKQEAEYG
ncbi:MAG: hypothetical protein PHH77_09765 [Victivallaceae bacterium]|nr:hypothetical protein [Victivallaceae bacterium]